MEKIKIIAEIGHNHNGNMELATTMIDEAKNCGADIAKFQLYDVDTIKESWQSRYQELKWAELSREQNQRIMDHCKKTGIEYMASVFDHTRIEWIGDQVKRWKIASRSFYDLDLWAAMEGSGLPIIASTGKCPRNPDGTMKPVKVPYDKAELLFCISEYPAHITSEIFPAKFSRDTLAGFSDHTIGCYWAREAIKRGAAIIEKHFTLSHRLPGHNQKHSVEPWELKDLVTYARQYERGITY